MFELLGLPVFFFIIDLLHVLRGHLGRFKNEPVAL